MKVKIVLAMTTAALVVAGVAVAETNKLKGDVKNDSNAKVSMKVVVKNGVPVKAKDVKVTNLNYKCINSGDTGERSFEFAKVPITPAIEPGSYDLRASEVKGGDTYEISGTTKNGTKVKGSPSVRVAADETCASQLAGDFTFTAK